MASLAGAAHASRIFSSAASHLASSGLADASRFFSGSSSGFFGPHLEQALAIFLEALAHLDQS